MKTSSSYFFCQCTNLNCLFRFPIETDPNLNTSCPQCGAVTEYSSRVHIEPSVGSTLSGNSDPGISVYLDNIRSAYNVGSIFRTADGAGIKHLYLGGITPTPDMAKVAKTALGADRWISWSYHLNGPNKILELKKKGWKVWALENMVGSQSLDQTIAGARDQSILLVVGNEITGIDPQILAVCDLLINLPMSGYKQSLNVSVAFGVAVYWLRFAIDKT